MSGLEETVTSEFVSAFILRANRFVTPARLHIQAYFYTCVFKNVIKNKVTSQLLPAPQELFKRDTASLARRLKEQVGFLVSRSLTVPSTLP